MDYSEAKKLVKARLSEKRWTHTKNVKKMAVKLARRWGTDPEKAAMAAILHDSAKELPKQELLQIFADNAIIAENAPSASVAGLARHRRRHPGRNAMGHHRPGNFVCHPLPYYRQAGNVQAR